MKINPPEGFSAVYLPTRSFMKAAKALKKLGFDVVVQMRADTDYRGKKVLDTCLDAVKQFNFNDVDTSITVFGCVSYSSMTVMISYSTKEEYYVHVAYNDVFAFEEVQRISELVQNVRTIVEEHMRSIHHEVLKIREFRKQIEEILLQRGYTKTEQSPAYKKHVGRFIVVVLCDENIQLCDVGVSRFGVEELPNVLDRIEEVVERIESGKHER